MGDVIKHVNLQDGAYFENLGYGWEDIEVLVNGS
jgi:hypothetical protein